MKVPSPALVQRTSEPQTSHLYLFPSLLTVVHLLFLSFFRQKPYFFCSMGCPQQVTVPLPPRVTITSAPHFPHKYLFPT
jgi:hypothetical protein